MDALGGGDVHGGGKRVVGGLRHVHIVVGMDRILGAENAAGEFDGAIGDDFVGVHIGLRAAAGLPDAQGKFVVQFSGDDFIAGLQDEAGLLRREFAQLLIHQRAGLLQNSKGANQLGGHGVPADIEVHQRASRLGAPVDVRGNFDRPHAVAFDSRGFLCDHLAHKGRVPFHP